jgi:cytochrome c oxidase subunit 1
MVVDGTGPGLSWRNRLTLPALWIAGGLFILILNGLSILRPVPSENFPAGSYAITLHENNFMVVRDHYNLSLAATFAVFAGIYLVVDTVLGIRFRRLLGWANFAFMLVGASLIVAPSLFLQCGGLEHAVDLWKAFIFLSYVSTLGYIMTLASVLLLVGLLAETLALRLLRKSSQGIN